MSQNTRDIQSCFHLLQKVLLEAFQTETHYFTPPYDYFAKIDHGIRNVMWPDFIHKNDTIRPSADFPDRRFFVVRSNLDFYNIIIYLNCETEPDFYSVGPFRSEDLSPDISSKLSKDLNLSIPISNALESYYNRLPYVSLSSIMNVVKQLVIVYFPEFEQISPIYVAFEDQEHAYNIDMQTLNDYSSDYAEMYKENFLRFSDALQKGNAELAHDTLTQFIADTKLLATNDLEECRNFLGLLNGSCHCTMLNTNVHPAHVLKLYNSLCERIESLNNHEAVLNMANDICHKYCLLVKNYAFPEYSKTIRSVINYINLHLDEELSLALLSERFHKNASFLSSSFTKEVGTTITNYIHQTRINEAIRYFNTTKMSVSEVSLAVGFQDFAYFSRLFHKQVGCSPRDYCKKIR